MDGDWRPFIYGGIASCLAESGTFPIDTVKTRLQIQGQFTNGTCKLKYRGMVHVFLLVSKEEGLSALYSGISAALLRQATYGSIKFGLFYSMKHFIKDKTDKDDFSVNLGCAIISGAVSSAIANPTDVVKVRFQTNHYGVRRNVFAVFKDIYVNEGIRGLWKGVVPTSQRASVIAGVELPVYEFSKSYLTTLIGNNPFNHFISSIIASIGSAITSTPIDVIRTRLMNQKYLKTCNETKFNTHKLYTGSWDCCCKTLSHEGFLALYKGFVPTWIRMGPWNIIFFIAYEQLMKL